jgi:hypothetical protein
MYSLIGFFIKVDVSIKSSTFFLHVSVSVLYEVQEKCCVLRTCLSLSLCVTYCQCLNNLLDLMNLISSCLQNSPRIVTDRLHVKT